MYFFKLITALHTTVWTNGINRIHVVPLEK